MALKLGSLYVDLQARTSAFGKGMAAAMKDVERFAKQAKQVSSEVSMVAGAMAAVGVAAVKMASSVDGPTKSAMDGLQKSTQLLAVQVADMLLPAVKELSSIFRSAAGFVAGLDPEFKKQVATFAVVAVQVAALAKLFSVLWGAIAAGAAIMKGVSLMAVSGVLLNIALAVGVVIAAVVLLHRAWRKNWGGIQEASSSVLAWLQDGFGQFANFMGKVWDFLVDGAAKFVDGFIHVGEVIERVTGKDLGMKGLRSGFEGLWKDLKSGGFFSEAFKFGKSVGQQVADGLAEEFAAIKAELGLDKMFKKGTPISLGRGMGKGGGARDPSGHEFAADEAMRSAALLAAGTLRDMSAEAAQFKKSLADVDIAQEVKKWVAALDRAPATSMSGGLASVSLSDPSVVNSRRGAFGGPQSAIDTKAKEAAAAISRAGKTIAGTMMSGLGDLGKAISNIASAAAQGGPWAAMMAAVMEVFSRMESFQKMMSTLSYGLERLGQFMEPLVGQLFGIVETLTVVGTEALAPLFDALKPLFDGLTKFATGLIPIVSSTAALFEGVAPILEVIGNVVGGILEALKPLLDIVGGIMKTIATVLLGIIIGLNELAAAFGDQKARAEADRLKGVIDRMWAPAANDLAISQGEAARETWRNAAAQGAAADAAKKVSASLSNVPTGFNIANARYQADLGITAGNGYIGGGSGGGVTINGNVTVTSSATTIGGVAADAKKEAARERGQRTGNPSNRSGSGGRDG